MGWINGKCADHADRPVKNCHYCREWAKARRSASVTAFIRSQEAEARKSRLLDLLTSDIYTDAPEYAERVREVERLIPLVLGGSR